MAEAELDLHRLTVDEAIPKLNEFLYQAFMGNMSAVRINHGRGTGTLRRAVQRELKNNTLVKSFRPGGYYEGGDGVTIAEMADH